MARPPVGMESLAWPMVLNGLFGVMPAYPRPQ